MAAVTPVSATGPHWHATAASLEQVPSLRVEQLEGGARCVAALTKPQQMTVGEQRTQVVVAQARGYRLSSGEDPTVEVREKRDRVMHFSSVSA